ncbi:MAG: hypothetical protein EGQ81_09335, partial [Akkermansia sp.]|nr:hypothetical protein [Akkermansia sp.]
MTGGWKKKTALENEKNAEERFLRFWKPEGFPGGGNPAFPCSLFPVPCSLFPVPCSLFPVPCS